MTPVSMVEWELQQTLQPQQQWAHSLASMVQVALVGYLTGGAFLDLAFWDMPYYLFAAVAVTRHLLGTSEASARAPAASVAAFRVPTAVADGQLRAPVDTLHRPG